MRVLQQANLSSSSSSSSIARLYSNVSAPRTTDAREQMVSFRGTNVRQLWLWNFWFHQAHTYVETVPEAVIFSESQMEPESQKTFAKHY